jgi:lipopolysaccharide/colanic/teichoic acid biosynthesis glycosyltransferase
MGAAIRSPRMTRVAEVTTLAPAWRRVVVATLDPAGCHGDTLLHGELDELVIEHRAFGDLVRDVPYTRRPDLAIIVSDDDATGSVFAPALGRSARVFKRTLDLVVGATTLTLTAPIVLAAMAAIRLETPGPVLFRQERPGLNGRAFTMLKLRTMHADNDDTIHRDYVASLIHGDGTAHDGIYKLRGDRRVTRVGRFLRRYSLDELPQLVNVLRGDMSLVGPRPPVPAEVDHYDAAMWLRLRVKPGMTGAWQVAGRGALPYDEMVRLDVGYWRHWTLRAELRILARTLPSVVRGDTTA